MKKITNYVRSEWRYWLASVFVVIGLSIQPHAEAEPTHKYTAGQFEIFDNWDANTWYIKFGKVIKDLKQPYDDIKVVWSGEYKGSSLVLLSGQQGRMCEMNFRFFFTDAEGGINEDSDFNTCYAEHVSVSIVKDELVVKMDGKVKTIRLW